MLESARQHSIVLPQLLQDSEKQHVARAICDDDDEFHRYYFRSPLRAAHPDLMMVDRLQPHRCC